MRLSKVQGYFSSLQVILLLLTPPKVVIASKESSIFEGHESHPCDRTHTEMNKFDGPKDAAYKALSNKLKDIVLHTLPKIQKLRNCEFYFD